MPPSSAPAARSSARFCSQTPQASGSTAAASVTEIPVTTQRKPGGRHKVIIDDSDDDNDAPLIPLPKHKRTLPTDSIDTPSPPPKRARSKDNPATGGHKTRKSFTGKPTPPLDSIVSYSDSEDTLPPVPAPPSPPQIAVNAFRHIVMDIPIDYVGPQDTRAVAGLNRWFMEEMDRRYQYHYAVTSVTTRNQIPHHLWRNKSNGITLEYHNYPRTQKNVDNLARNHATTLRVDLSPLEGATIVPWLTTTSHDFIHLRTMVFIGTTTREVLTLPTCVTRVVFHITIDPKGGFHLPKLTPGRKARHVVYVFPGEARCCHKFLTEDIAALPGMVEEPYPYAVADPTTQGGKYTIGNLPNRHVPLRRGDEVGRIMMEDKFRKKIWFKFPKHKYRGQWDKPNSDDLGPKKDWGGDFDKRSVVERVKFCTDADMERMLRREQWAKERLPIRTAAWEKCPPKPVPV